MANIDAPRGLRAVENGVAGTVPRLRTYTVGTGPVYEGDIVILASGLIEPFAGTNTAIIGVAAHYGASGDEVQVYDDPEQIFEVQADDDTLTDDPADWLGQYFAVLPGTPDTDLLQSGSELDGDTAAATAGAGVDVQVIGISKAINNESSAAGVANTRFLVKLAAHVL